MPKFRKKPVVIEAFQIPCDKMTAVPDWWRRPGPLAQLDTLPRSAILEAGDIALTEDGGVLIGTLEGTHYGAVGDWVIRGVNGEMYPCKHEIFEKTYETEIL